MSTVQTAPVPVTSGYNDGLYTFSTHAGLAAWILRYADKADSVVRLGKDRSGQHWFRSNRSFDSFSNAYLDSVEYAHDTEVLRLKKYAADINL